MRRLKRKVVRTSQYRGFGDFPAAGKDRDVRISCAAAFVVFFAAMTLSGCQSEAPYFRPNLVEIEIEQDAGEPVTEDQQRTINETMLAMFGTPDHPANPFPQDDELVDAVSPLKTFGFDVEKLKIAAGPAYRDQKRSCRPANRSASKFRGSVITSASRLPAIAACAWSTWSVHQSLWRLAPCRLPTAWWSTPTLPKCRRCARGSWNSC